MDEKEKADKLWIFVKILVVFLFLLLIIFGSILFYDVTDSHNGRNRLCNELGGKLTVDGMTAYCILNGEARAVTFEGRGKDRKMYFVR